MLILTDDVGILQHARETVPDRSHGYCTDDVTRALIVMLVRLRQNSERDAMRLASTYLAFLRHAQLDDGRFHNFMSYERTWLDETGGQDSFGRAIWALGYTLRYAPRKSWRRLAAAMLDRALTHAERLDFPRSQAYAMLGLAHAVDAKPTPERTQLLRSLAQSLATLYEREGSAEWEWFEPMMTYDNARLPEALLRAAAALGDDHLQTIGRRTLGFLERIVFEDGIFVPVGNDGWLRRGGPRARFAQQPLEAAAMVDAELAACDVSFKSAKAAHRAAARAAAAWFDGKNLLGIRMAHGGGCYDGLERNGPNRNMGAESTLAYLAAAGRIQE